MESKNKNILCQIIETVIQQAEKDEAFGLTASNIQKQAAAISSYLARIEIEAFGKAANGQTESQ